MLLEKSERMFLTIVIGLLIMFVLVLVLTGPKRITDEPYKYIGKKILVITAGDFSTEIEKLNKFYNGNNELQYDVKDYFVSSKEITPKNWNDLADIIYSNYNNYDAFIILHYPETLSYTASSLAFMLENLSKTIIIATNAILAVRLAQEYRLPEVVVISDFLILRGCRTKQIKSTFISPSFPPLGKIDDSIEINKELILKSPTEPFKFLPIEPNKKIMVIKVFPSINLYDMVKDQRIFGIVLETYNEGDVPTDPNFIETLQGLIKTGTVIVSVSQTMSIVEEKGKDNLLEKIGVIPCGGMTTESAFAKLYLIMSQLAKYDTKLVSNLMRTNMRGEI